MPGATPPKTRGSAAQWVFTNHTHRGGSLPAKLSLQKGERRRRHGRGGARCLRSGNLLRMRLEFERGVGCPASVDYAYGPALSWTMITEPTRRNLADELVLRNMTPNGRLDEVAFFSRIFNLNDLPTTDYRENQFPDMAADLWQHRVRNPTDWPDDWWVTDERLDLLHVSDETFLRFLAEIVHPIVRPETAERERYLEVFNRHLAPEGWEIGVVGQLGAHSIYGGRRLDGVPPAVAGEARELAIALGEYVS